MSHRRVRIFQGKETRPNPTSPPADEESVTVRLNDVFPLLADAMLTERSWLSDFADDEITISGDLFDVLMAYRHLRMPA